MTEKHPPREGLAAMTGQEGERPVTAMAGLREIHPGLPRLRANTTATGPLHDKWAGEEAAKPPPALTAWA